MQHHRTLTHWYNYVVRVSLNVLPSNMKVAVQARRMFNSPYTNARYTIPIRNMHLHVRQPDKHLLVQLHQTCPSVVQVPLLPLSTLGVTPRPSAPAHLARSEPLPAVPRAGLAVRPYAAAGGSAGC